MHILVVEDEPGISDFLHRGLAAEGYSVTAVADGTEAAGLAKSADVDLMVLDLMLPGRPGPEVLAEVRKAKPQLPVVVLSARGEPDSKVALLDLGATDYVTKPFSFEELVARIRAHLRDRDEASSARLEVGDIRMDLVGRRVERGGMPVRLSGREFSLLAYLMRHPGQVLSRAELLRSVWGYDEDGDASVVTVYVGYLRQKLAGAGSPAPIDTVRSAGYRLRAGD